MFGFNNVKKFMDAIKTLRFYSMGVCLQNNFKSSFENPWPTNYDEGQVKTLLK